MARPRKQTAFEKQIADVLSAAIVQAIDVLWADLTAQVQKIASTHRPGTLRRLQIPPGPSHQPKRTVPGPNKIRDELVKLLRKHGGNISAVAREMGKERLQIRRWIKRHQLERNDYI